MSQTAHADLQTLAEKARHYCETDQHREFGLDGACHENVIGAADYTRLNTDYNPIIVWGVVSHADEHDTADTIDNVSEHTTHFWLELTDTDDQTTTNAGIIDVYTNNPLVGDTSACIESGIAYGGPQPDCYNTVEKFRYYGQITPHDLSHKRHFSRALSMKAVERL